MAPTAVARIAKQARSAFRKLFSPRMLAVSFRVVGSGKGDFVQSVHVDPTGIIRLAGRWKEGFDERDVPGVFLDGNAIPFLQGFRFSTHSLIGRSTDSLPQAGLALDYRVPSHLLVPSKAIEIDFGDGRTVKLSEALQFATPDYHELLASPEVFHRDQIYGFGPPKVDVHPEVLALAKQLRGPVLDFGCGRGALINCLLQIGTAAQGLELDNDLMRRSIPSERADKITLYNGSFPSPFKSGQFQSVVCSEVLEHITDYASAIKDIARLTKDVALFTVPDASAIPMGFRHGVIPWHMLEGTHVNFFTQQSLGRVLEPHFTRVEFGRLVAFRINDTEFYASLSAVCRK